MGPSLTPTSKLGVVWALPEPGLLDIRLSGLFGCVVTQDNLVKVKVTA